MATTIRVANIEMLSSRLRNNRGIRKANGFVINITLDETLRPLWKLTYYCGILLDWCTPIPKSNPYRIVKAVRYLMIALTFALLLVVTSFELMQLFVLIEKTPPIHKLIPILSYTIPLVLSVLIQVHFIRRRKEFLAFFKDWSQLEMEMAHLNPDYIMCKSKKMHTTMYAIYTGITLASVISFGSDIYNKPETPYLMSTYPAVRQVVPLFVIGFIHLLSIMLIWILTSLGENVPSFTYYHSALAVSCLENDVIAIFDRLLDQPERWDIAIHRTWTRFDKISKIVSRVDFLFGSFVIYGQAGAIFFMTALIYSILYYIGDSVKLGSLVPVLSFTLNLLAIAFRFSSSMIISSELHWSVNNLRSTLNYLLNKHWHRILKEDRDLLRSFVWRLKSESLAANPLGVYKVTPSVLLSVLGVIISYVTVLLQSK